MKRGLIVLSLFMVLISSSFVCAQIDPNNLGQKGANSVKNTPSYPGILCWACSAGTVKVQEPYQGGYQGYYGNSAPVIPTYFLDTQNHITGLKGNCSDGYQQFTFTDSLPKNADGSTSMFNPSSNEYTSKVSCEISKLTSSDQLAVNQFEDNNNNGLVDKGDRFSGLAKEDLIIPLDGTASSIPKGMIIFYNNDILTVYNPLLVNSHIKAGNEETTIKSGERISFVNGQRTNVDYAKWSKADQGAVGYTPPVSLWAGVSSYFSEKWGGIASQIQNFFGYVNINKADVEK